MEEIFVPLKIKGFEDCKTSNFGRFMSGKGKIRKPRLVDGTLRIDISKKKNGKRVARLANYSLAKMVYIHFSEVVPKGDFEIKYKDGDRLNCMFDNLNLAVGTPTEEQIENYKKSIFPCVIHIIRHSPFYDYVKIGFDIDNCIGESCYLVWKYLKSYNSEKISFYKFCKKYVRIALITEYNNYKNFLFQREW